MGPKCEPHRRTLHPDLGAAMAVVARNSKRFGEQHEAEECSAGAGWHVYRIEKRSRVDA